MTKSFTCIICPMGCSLSVQYIPETKSIQHIEGATCKKGEVYARQEVFDPQRTIQTSVKVVGGALPLTSVKTSGSIPKDRIFDVMKIVKSLVLTAPVEIGTIAEENILDLGVDIVVTKPVYRVL